MRKLAAARLGNWRMSKLKVFFSVIHTSFPLSCFEAFFSPIVAILAAKHSIILLYCFSKFFQRLPLDCKTSDWNMLSGSTEICSILLYSDFFSHK